MTVGELFGTALLGLLGLVLVLLVVTAVVAALRGTPGHENAALFVLVLPLLVAFVIVLSPVALVNALIVRLRHGPAWRHSDR